jgi:DNA-binding SARP family transcriptional activator/predicted ATPase
MLARAALPKRYGRKGSAGARIFVHMDAARAGPARTPVRATRPLNVRLFGHLEIAVEGERISLATPRKTLQVLAYLLLHRGSAVSREYLAELLYPDEERGSARARLRATLFELPKILPKPATRYVTVEAEKIAWNPKANLWLDVEAFTDAANDRARLAEAIDLYRGDLLPDVYDEWLEPERERLRNVYLRCLSELISVARRNADLNAGIEAAHKLLAIDPWREDIVRRLVAMRFESGDRAGALSEYASFAKRLAGELGCEPMPETAAVAERIQRGEAPEEPENEPAGATPVGTAAILPFVGRRDEMNRLLQLWSHVARGRGACGFVGGETGIGKSRLVAEFARTVEERGGRVLFGTTGAPEAVPYESITDALRSALSLVVSLKPDIALAGVATIVPEIRARVELPALVRLDAESERVRLFESVFRCIAELARPRPVLVVLEDLHAAHSASMELVQYVLNRIAGVPVMFVITYRDDETPRLHALHRLRRDEHATAAGLNLWLGALSSADVDELRAALPAIARRSTEALITASQGNPLFLAQIATAAGHDEATAPSSLSEAVQRRIDGLSEDARSVAEIAGCVGYRFSREAVREVSAWEAASLTSALDELLDRRIVREAGGRVLEYAFTHNLVHETIVGAIPAGDAAVRRRRVARVLEELYPERFSEMSATLAAHYACGGDVVNATRCYLEAVRRSIAIAALDEAAALCESALALDPPVRLRLELLLELVTIESRRGRGESRAAALIKLERADAELGDANAHRQTLQRRIEYAATIGDIEMQAGAVRSLREHIPEGDLEWEAAATLAEARLEMARGDLARAYGLGEASLTCSRAGSDASAVAGALCFLADVESYRGNLTSAGEIFEEAARVAEHASDSALSLLALLSGWVMAYQRRDLPRCLDLSRHCVDLAAQLGDRPAEARALARLGISLQSVAPAEARSKYAAATRIHEESGDRIGAAARELDLAVLDTRLGFFERAVESTRRAISRFDDVGDERGRLMSRSNLVYLLACLKDVVGARRTAEGALDDARREGFGLIEANLLENLAMAEGAAGNFKRAIDLAEASFTVRSRSESETWSAKTLADIAIWYANVGNLDAARDAAQRLLADDTAITNGADWPTYCYWSGAQILRLAGETDGATRALATARRLMTAEAETLEPEDRESFLALEFHRDIVRAVEYDEWPNPPR